METKEQGSKGAGSQGIDREQVEMLQGVRDLETVMALEGLVEELRWSIVDRAAARGDPERYHNERMEEAWKRLFGTVRSGAWRVLCVTGWVPGCEELDMEAVLGDPELINEKQQEVAEALSSLEPGEVVAVHAFVRSLVEERRMEDEARDGLMFAGVLGRGRET